MSDENFSLDIKADNFFFQSLKNDDQQAEAAHKLAACFTGNEFETRLFTKKDPAGNDDELGYQHLDKDHKPSSTEFFPPDNADSPLKGSDITRFPQNGKSDIRIMQRDKFDNMINYRLDADSSGGKLLNKILDKAFDTTGLPRCEISDVKK